MVDPEDEEAAGLIVAGPTQFLSPALVASGSVMVPCDLCGSMVWLAPESQELLTEAKERELLMKVVCVFELEALQIGGQVAPGQFTGSPEHMIEVMELERMFRESPDDPLVQGG